jgi:conjugal transfer ATP-binding protein TraC
MNLPFLKKPKTEEVTPLSTQTQTFSQGLVSVKDVIAPPAIEVDFSHLKIGNAFFRTLFVAGYPRFVNANWLYPLISFDHALEVSMFVYPRESKEILDNLKRKVGEMEATIQSDIKRGRVIDPSVQVSLDDALALQQQLAKGAERFFQFGLYITIPASTIEELEQVSKQVESTLGSLLIISKVATLQMEEGFKTTLPEGIDQLYVTRNMDTTSLATTFPFTSSELTANEGILYGINEHNDSLILFDRFTLENANSIVLSKSGGGKSYLVKLETLRSLMFGTEIIVIDPEREYKTLTDAIGGEHIEFNYQSGIKINPFDLSGVYEEGENELGLKILSLHTLMRIVMGALSPAEDALLDRALILTYKQKGITPDPQTQTKEPPLMEDLYKTLLGMEEPEAKSLADKLEKFIKGSLAGIFDHQSNINIKNPFTVFGIRDLEEELRPIAMFIILDYVWTKIKKDLKKRILVIDEAWYLMKYPDSATFVYSIAKRARKYYLGLTTITQDIEDFLSNDYGKAIVTNSSIQILLKQSPAAIDKIAQVFYLSQGEKHLLLSAEVGEGLFFAGPAHVALRVVASPDEHRLITSKPEDLIKMRQEAASIAVPSPTPPPPTPPPPLPITNPPTQNPNL